MKSTRPTQPSGPIQLRLGDRFRLSKDDGWKEVVEVRGDSFSYFTVDNGGLAPRCGAMFNPTRVFELISSEITPEELDQAFNGAPPEKPQPPSTDEPMSVRDRFALEAFKAILLTQRPTLANRNVCRSYALADMALTERFPGEDSSDNHNNNEE